MTKKILQQRTRIFFSVEGESEQSVIKWLQGLSEQKGLHVHLDCQVLGGGGYKSMLDGALHYKKRKERYKAKHSILLVDADRAERGDDGWSLSQLRQAASKHKIIVYILQPNLEGLLLRLVAGNEHLQPSAVTVQQKLRKVWSNYKKPADARTLASKFGLSDLFRVACVDVELKMLLETIGLY